jgi:uncharacterized protein (TIGR03000 family)
MFKHWHSSLGLLAVVTASLLLFPDKASARGPRGVAVGRGGFARGGFARGGFARGGFARGGFARGGSFARGGTFVRSRGFARGGTVFRSGLGWGRNGGWGWRGYGRYGWSWPWYYGSYWPSYYSDYSPLYYGLNNNYYYYPSDYGSSSYFLPDESSYSSRATEPYPRPSYSPRQEQVQGQENRQDNVGHVVVKLDDPEAVVSINGKQTHQNGKVRRFVTPELQPGERFHAKITVRWDSDDEPVERTREVTVRPGQVKQLTFKSPSADQRQPETMEPEQQLPKKAPRKRKMQQSDEDNSEPKSKKSGQRSQDDQPDE